MSLFNNVVMNLINGAGQMGGARASGNGMNTLLIFVTMIVLFLVGAYIVQYSYNMVVPKLLLTTTAEPEKILTNYRPLTYVDAIWLTLLVRTLI